MVIIPADGNSFGQGILNFNIQQLVARLLLVQGFSNPLPSLPQIDDAIQQQNAAIANGTAGPFASFDMVSAGLDLTGRKPPAIFPGIASYRSYQPAHLADHGQSSLKSGRKVRSAEFIPRVVCR